MIVMMIFPYPSWFSSVNQRQTRKKKVRTMKRKKMKNIISQLMMKVVVSCLISIILLCLFCFSNIKQHMFVRNIVWTRLIIVRLQWGYSSKFLCLWNTPAMLLLWLCYAAVMLLLWFYDAPDNLMLLLYYASVILLMIPQKETTTIQWIRQPPISK